MTKKLTVSELNKIGKELDEKKEVFLADGKYKIIVDKNLNNVKIKTMANEIQQCVEMILNDKSLKLDITKDASFLHFILILRNFTNLTIPLNIKKMISISNTLINTGLLEELLGKAFTADQLNYLNQELKKVLRDDEDANIQESE